MFPIAETDDKILSIIESDVLSPLFVESVLSSLDHAPKDNPAVLQQQLKETADQLARLREAIKYGGGEIPE